MGILASCGPCRVLSVPRQLSLSGFSIGAGGSERIPPVGSPTAAGRASPSPGWCPPNQRGFTKRPRVPPGMFWCEEAICPGAWGGCWSGFCAPHSLNLLCKASAPGVLGGLTPLQSTRRQAQNCTNQQWRWGKLPRPNFYSRPSPASCPAPDGVGDAGRRLLHGLVAELPVPIALGVSTMAHPAPCPSA